ncbi:MAG TPA: alpha/beta hydrolase [Cytophagales bacterium]|nr:alpha/beta hydrolase [Cytophagales bacterium]HAA20702.1 alpha/beta hydrolase [Cytophagales bacterium]HAP63748.1 alpha/beta hydrolase [Cytophagales bacterium]
MKSKLRRRIRLIWFTLVGVFFVWQWTTYQSRGLPEGVLDTNGEVRVEKTADYYTFAPVGEASELEVIFFQGGLTDPKAYAPLCRQLAENGYVCHLIRMDWRMPVWDYQKVGGLFDLDSGKYVLGGHSQGAKMAAQWVYENPGQVLGLFLLGTSHPRDYSLAGQDLPTLKLYAEHDGLASVDEVLGNEHLLPLGTVLQLVEGGNHSQFGHLGRLLTDERATLSRPAQQQITRDHLLTFLNSI